MKWHTALLKLKTIHVFNGKVNKMSAKPYNGGWFFFVVVGGFFMTILELYFYSLIREACLTIRIVIKCT